MEHLSDRQLLELRNGRVEPAESLAMAAHVEQCAECRRRVQELSALWTALGAFDVGQPPANLAARVVEALPAPLPVWRRPSILRSMRVAAAVLLAAGVGHAAGRLAWRPSAPTGIDEAAAASALHVDDLSASSGTALLAALDQPADAQGGRQ